MSKRKSVPAIPAVPATQTRAAELLELLEAAPFLGLTEWQLRGLVASRSLPVVQVGRKFYFRRATLLRWAERAEGLVRQ